LSTRFHDGRQDIGLRLNAVEASTRANDTEKVKAEISSLKSLMLSRQQFPPSPAISASIPEWQRSPVAKSASTTK